MNLKSARIKTPNNWHLRLRSSCKYCMYMETSTVREELHNKDMCSSLIVLKKEGYFG